MEKYEPECMSSEFEQWVKEKKLEMKLRPFPVSSICLLREDLIKSELYHTDKEEKHQNL